MAKTLASNRLKRQICEPQDRRDQSVNVRFSTRELAGIDSLREAFGGVGRALMIRGILAKRIPRPIPTINQEAFRLLQDLRDALLSWQDRLESKSASPELEVLLRLEKSLDAIRSQALGVE